jgi:hypothetical protein
MISGVSNHTSCRQIFKDYNILTLFSLYILELVCFIKRYKDVMAVSPNMDFWSKINGTELNRNVHKVSCCFM